jgi:putative PIN family toxin of toxin-antitoxin system
VKRVTLDSNIYISALVFGGKPKRILEMAIEGHVEIAISDSIVEEVRRHLRAKFGWSEERTTEAVESINEYAVHVTPSEQIDAVPVDPDDNRVLECAVEAASDVILSGDLDLLRIGSYAGIPIQTVSEFLRAFERESDDAE